ncbi:hypothetical protein M9Y10_023262 [Tritrichomonas musculus]|uniref:Mitochondrial import inner membrane translocase subunit TIM50 n=1 Tax=Tritrichomonas musculus TaxID=1915356 RepID=A0ABR2KUN9_9EUKA
MKSQSLKSNLSPVFKLSDIKANDLKDNEILDSAQKKKVKTWKSMSNVTSIFNSIPLAKRKILVLDLDETLIHTSDIPPHPRVQTIKCGNPPVTVFKRPGVDSFIQLCTAYFDTYVYTYGTIIYADPILDILCPMIRQDHRLYRHRCQYQKGHVVKDLNRFNRSLNEVILIEDSTDAKKQHPENTILIPSWMGTPTDSILIDYLPPILLKLAGANDVRPIIQSLNPKDCIKMQ